MQHLVVALIVLAAAGYALWYWMPARWRRLLAARVAGRSERLAQTIGATPGCGACDSCGSCATPGQPSDAGRNGAVKTIELPASRRPSH